MSAAISSASYDGEGMKRVYENDAWTVGIKNYKVANSIDGFTELERHNETDELFVLLSGRCVLLAMTEEGGTRSFRSTVMPSGAVCTIPRGLWHTTITWPETKLALIENANTGMENSDVVALPEADLHGARESIHAELSSVGGGA